MAAKIISIFDHLKGEKGEAHGAVCRALDRPLPHHGKDNTLSQDELANWFLQGLWLEGFKVVRCDNSGEDE